MDIWETDKLILFIAFVIPGFISIKWYELVFPGVEKESSDRLIDAISYSSINYALLIIPINYIESSNIRHSFLFLYYIFYIFIFLYFSLAQLFGSCFGNILGHEIFFKRMYLTQHSNLGTMCSLKESHTG
jgi:hypothetical protein